MGTPTQSDSSRPGARSNWQVTRAVWHALFVREFLSRLMADRMAWFWMIAEPVAFVAVMIAVRVVALGRDTPIYGAEFVPWLITGLMGFFLVRENLIQPMNAVDANRGLFAYRQVKPVDTILVRGYLEGMIRSVVFALFIAIGLLIHIDLVADRPLMALGGWLSLWALGLGGGLTLSVLANLVPEVGKIVRILTLPLLILSGVIFPLQMLPHGMLEWIMLNPIAHGLEVLRMGFFAHYHEVPGTSPLYLWYWTLGLLTIGLILHLRFEKRLKAR